MQIGDHDHVKVKNPDPAYPFHQDVGTVIHSSRYGWVVVRWDYMEEGWVEEEFIPSELVRI